MSINDYLVALNRIARPDVVFRLWGHMQTLFEMCPGARTLSMGWGGQRLESRECASVSSAVTYWRPRQFGFVFSQNGAGVSRLSF